MMTVLVVDDNPVDRHRVNGLLRSRPNWVTILASNGQEALAAIEHQTPDVVLTDLRMPGMNGLELVEEIRKRFPALPIVLMTAFGSEDIALLALQRGAASYVPKRNLARQLHETLEQVLEVALARRDHQRVLDATICTESHFVLGNDLSLLTPLLGYLRERLVGLRLCDDNEAIRVGVALREAVINAIHHGNLEVGSELLSQGEQVYNDRIAERSQQSPYQDRHVFLCVRESRTEVVYIVRDEGPGFDPARLPDSHDPATLGTSDERGLRLIRAFMDEVRHNVPGNEITLVKRRSLERQEETTRRFHECMATH